jgi:nitrite reductase (cytochrome c-552)
MKKSYLAVAMLVLALAVAMAGCAVKEEPIKQPSQSGPTQADLALGADSSKWAEIYPEYFASYLKNEEVNREKHPDAPKPYPYVANNPELKVIWDNFGFSKEYNKPRGHVWATTSVENIARPKPGAVCYTCKSTDVAVAYLEKGAGTWETEKWDEAVARNGFAHPIGCIDCHDAKTNEVRLSRPYVAEALKRQGKDDAYIAKEMNSLVCAQCHVEYFFKPGGTLEVTLPWDNGFSIEDIDRHFKEYQRPDGTIGFTDFTNKLVDVGIVKIQHPEYEFYKSNGTSIHDKLGLTCASCHMPKMEQDGKEITSHWWTSPLRHMEVSCFSCHNDLNATKERVKAIQKDVKERQKAILGILGEAGETIKAKQDAGATVAQLKEAKQNFADGVLYWDWVAAENSYGFHNKTEAHRVFDLAEAFAKKALELAKAIK